MDRRAFTLIELLVVLGVVLILAGLLLPGFSKSYARAKQAADENAVRQNVMTLSLYASDYGDLYPIVKRHLPMPGDPPAAPSSIARWFYFTPLVEGGYFGSIAEVDPPHYRRGYGDRVSLAMSDCVILPPEHMRRGYVPRQENQLQVPIRTARLSFPSLKGVILKFNYNSRGSMPVFSAPRHANNGLFTFPVGLGDGSVRSGLLRDFNFGTEEFFLEHWVGVPVISTWGGVYSRDL